MITIPHATEAIRMQDFETQQIPHAIEAIRMQGFQTHTAVQPISIQPLQTQQKPRVTEAWHNAEKHSLFLSVDGVNEPLRCISSETGTGNGTRTMGDKWSWLLSWFRCNAKSFTLFIQPICFQSLFWSRLRAV